MAALSAVSAVLSSASRSRHRGPRIGLHSDLRASVAVSAARWAMAIACPRCSFARAACSIAPARPAIASLRPPAEKPMPARMVNTRNPDQIAQAPHDEPICPVRRNTEATHGRIIATMPMATPCAPCSSVSNGVRPKLPAYCASMANWIPPSAIAAPARTRAAT